MTIYEHAMVGITGALAVGLSRRGGWQIVAMAGLAAVLPDWDGLTIVVGFHAYAEGHRVWGHNLLVAGVAAALLAVVLCRWDLLTSARQWSVRHGLRIADGTPARGPAWSRRTAALWMLVAIVAAYSHLAADVAFSAGSGQPVWGVPLLWPFAHTAWAYPLVPWGDIGTTLIFAASMFALVRWPAHARVIAASTLVLVLGYILVRGRM